MIRSKGKRKIVKLKRAASKLAISGKIFCLDRNGKSCRRVDSRVNVHRTVRRRKFSLDRELYNVKHAREWRRSYKRLEHSQVSRARFKFVRFPPLDSRWHYELIIRWPREIILNTSAAIYINDSYDYRDPIYTHAFSFDRGWLINRRVEIGRGDWFQRNEIKCSASIKSVSNCRAAFSLVAFAIVIIVLHNYSSRIKFFEIFTSFRDTLIIIYSKGV